MPDITHLARQFFSYAVIGGLATVVDWGSFWLFHQPLGLHYRLAVSISFTLGCTANFLLNKNLTFKKATSSLRSQIPLFVLVSFVSLGMTVLLMSIEVEWLDMPSLWARMLTTAIMLVVNFLLQKLIVFERRLR